MKNDRVYVIIITDHAVRAEMIGKQGSFAAYGHLTQNAKLRKELS